jgi:hypothetical protein
MSFFAQLILRIVWDIWLGTADLTLTVELLVHCYLAVLVNKNLTDQLGDRQVYSPFQ